MHSTTPPTSPIQLPATTTLTFIGAGNMATSIAGGLIQTGHPASQITLCDPSETSRSRASEALPGAHLLPDCHTAAPANIIVLAVKPQVMQAACNQVRQLDLNNTLILSVAAGITIAQMAQWLNRPSQSLPFAIVRCMPNTPALINEGATGFFVNIHVNSEQKQMALAILSAIGDALEVPTEDDLNSVTALSGSGPAYYFYLMEAMIKAGESMGLSRQTATQLTLKTALGAAKLACSEGSPDPSTLRARVTSPGGTTERALSEFNAANVDQALIGGMQSARDRAIELSRETHDAEGTKNSKESKK